MEERLHQALHAADTPMGFGEIAAVVGEIYLDPAIAANFTA